MSIKRLLDFIFDGFQLKKCNKCNGTGWIKVKNKPIEKRCPECNGRGYK